MNNSRFNIEENIPLVQDESNEDYMIPDTRRIKNTSFTGPDTTEVTSRQKVKQDTNGQTDEFDRQWNVAGDTNLADIDLFMIKGIKNRQSIKALT